jgi:hypothetical protein
MAELLLHLRGQVAATGRADLDVEIIESDESVAMSPRDRLLHYIEGLRRDLALESAASQRQLFAGYAELVQVGRADRFSGIDLILTEQDQQLYGRESVDLLSPGGGSEALASALLALEIELREGQ